jgi:anti-sigma factor RsiW
MNITREVVVDLLPPYLAGEASTDTRALVEQFAQQDPEFARLLEAQRRELAAGTRALRQPGAGLSPDHEVQTLARTRRMAERLRWLMAIALMCTAFPLSFTFEGGRVTFLLLRDVPVLALACWVAAGIFWGMFLATRRRLSASGL